MPNHVPSGTEHFHLLLLEATSELQGCTERWTKYRETHSKSSLLNRGLRVAFKLDQTSSRWLLARWHDRWHISSSQPLAEQHCGQQVLKYTATDTHKLTINDWLPFRMSIALLNERKSSSNKVIMFHVSYGKAIYTNIQLPSLFTHIHKPVCFSVWLWLSVSESNDSWKKRCPTFIKIRWESHRQFLGPRYLTQTENWYRQCSRLPHCHKVTLSCIHMLVLMTLNVFSAKKKTTQNTQMRAGWHNILLWRRKFCFLPYHSTSEAVAHPISHQSNPSWLQSPEKK